MSSVTEEDVGCYCFVNDYEGMSGIIKHKFSDFHVHEIDKFGKVQYLESLDPLPQPSYPEGYENWLNSNEIFFDFKPESEEQVARIYYEQPNMDINYTTDKCTIERKFKRRPRQIITSFTLCKENLNQQQAIGLIAKKTGKHKKNIGFAGTKDKRGITTQILTIKDVPISKLIEISTNLSDNVMIGQFKECINPISLGENKGNRFTILIRDVKIPERNVSIDEGIRNRINELNKHGFLNYFGMQRFGTGKIPTHYYGILILKREWKELINIFITPQEEELEGTRKAKQLYQQTKDAKAALRLIPKSAQSEYAIFQAMAELPPEKQLSQPFELFKRIDRRQRMLYVHAYQSYLWNHMVSSRWMKHGNNVVVGDHVQTKEGKIIEITNQNRNDYSIFDVVISLPSGDNTPPEMVELMAKDGVTPEMFQKLSSEFGAGGDWRRMVIKPQNLEWELIRHDDFDALLIDSDMDKLRGVSNASNRVPNGRYVSLNISFSLGSGMYATMCLRELLKRSTEWFTDSSMSKADKKPFWLQLNKHCLIQ